MGLTPNKPPLEVENIIMKPDFWTQGPNSLDSIYQVQPSTPKHQIRWSQRKEIYYTAWDMVWEEAEEALNSSSAIFGVQTWAIGLNRQKNWGQGTRYA
jgi:hypothetical protein